MSINRFSMSHISIIIAVAFLVGTHAQQFSNQKKPVEVKAMVATPAILQDTIKETGRRIFFSHCNTCHKDSVINIAPGLTIMSGMSTRSIVSSLTNGKMRQQGSVLSANERIAVAQWITNSPLKETAFPDDAFTPFALATKTPAVFDHSGWGNNKEGTGYRSTQQAGISKGNVKTLKLKWAFAFPDASIMRAKPAVIDNWLIVGGQFGDVIAINRKTGKMGWRYTAAAAVRGAISVVRSGNAITAYFADYSTNTYAIDVRTGKMIWNKRAGYEAQSSTTGSVAVHNGIVYVPISTIEVGAVFNGNLDCCFSSGGVVALDAKTGKEVWRHRITPKATESGKKRNGKPGYGPSGVPVWCSPTIDAKRGRLYIGTGQNYSYPATKTSDAIQALDLNTGKVIWTFQATANDMYNVACPFMVNCPDPPGPDVDFGMAPMLVKRKDGTEILVVGQKSGVVHALTTEGKILWQTRVGKGGTLGGIHWGMSTDGEYAYAANSDNIIGIDRRDSSYPVSPGVYAFDLQNGNVIWKAPTPACTQRNCLKGNSAAPLSLPGLVIAGALDGHIRAYDNTNGNILWDFDTRQEYQTVNGIAGKGGAIDGPPPVVADGMLYVNSGYGMFGQWPGNVLLAFEVER